MVWGWFCFIPGLTMWAFIMLYIFDHAQALVRIGTLLHGVSLDFCTVSVTSISLSIANIHSSKTLQQHHIFRYFPVLVTRVSLLCVFSHATWTKLPNKWTYYLGFSPFFGRFTWSPYLDPWQQFQNILTRCFSKMLVRGRERDLGVEYQNIKKPHNHSKRQITQEHFLTFLRPRLRQPGGNGSPRRYLAGNSEGGWCRHASKSAVYHDPLSTTDIYLNMLKSALIFLHCHICPVLL